MALRSEEPKTVESWEGQHHAGGPGMTALRVPENQCKQDRPKDHFEDEYEAIHVRLHLPLHSIASHLPVPGIMRDSLGL